MKSDGSVDRVHSTYRQARSGEKPRTSCRYSVLRIEDPSSDANEHSAFFVAARICDRNERARKSELACECVDTVDQDDSAQSNDEQRCDDADDAGRPQAHRRAEK